ncbi:MAG: sugar ABC transporter substrate-binding protein [Chloroflexota bacterium]
MHGFWMTRRRFVLGAARTALASSTLLAACAPTTPRAGSTPTGGGKPGKLRLPTFVPIGGPPADVAGTDTVPAAYSRYPNPPFKSVATPPGRGGEVVAVSESSYPLVAFDNNPLWQELNKQLNVNLKLNIVPFSDYAFGKFQAIVAGNDLPDLMYVPIGGAIPELGAFLEAKCADLTPYVSGDAVKDYPNLANLPTIAWRGVVYNGKIFGVPVPSSLFYWGLWHRPDLVRGMDAAGPKDADDFKRLLVDATNPQANRFGIGWEVGNRYAFGLTNTGGSFWPALYGAPNNWAMENGAFTKDFETEQFKAGVGLARDVFAAGSFDPNSTLTTGTADMAFQGGRYGFRFCNALNVLNYETGARLVPPFAGAQGGRPSYNLGIGNFGFTLLKASSAERVKEMLGVMNYFAAPFGSQEHLLLNYGVKDVEFVYDANGNPVLTEKGDVDAPPKGMPWAFFALPPRVLFDAKAPSFGPDMHRATSALSQYGTMDPTVGLYSPTNQRLGVAIGQRLADGLIDIVAGRRPLSDLGSLVSEWRTGGGDTIKTELASAYAAAQ